ncbi:MAG: DEAD/DEAH box helicase [Candidatus Endonucleobacter bathymodioli]|uniref:DEAD/DEAH box helicase n=1 Tax=Candidatus Endonucleibacter bathymodioli TaxID=539814 RepID=A0AA90ST91_9GAMM|nr:DEAD/DEAH box helicase [Candidatus Endonucleobacter bathymodioli]
MDYKLRPYQKQAVRSVIQHFKKSSDPAVVVLPTGAGKSLVISELARLARGRVLVMAHVKELVAQNHEKYESYHLKASIFSAGLGKKEASEQVVFGSIQSVCKNLNCFNDTRYTLLVIDECHRISLEKNTSYQNVINHLLTLNVDLKILGLTATPYRLGLGWIYQYHKIDNQKYSIRTEDDRFFKDCIFELPLSYMIDNRFLVPVTILDAPIAFYDFHSLTTGSSGQYRERDLNQLIHGESRATAKIINQVIHEATLRQGVMIFAATVEHAKEVFSYLPEGQAGLIVGETSRLDRNAIIGLFKCKKLKYLVNVSVLTTGFDVPHVDLIAILRPTASVSLYQQIIGRGLRLSPGKTGCLVMEFAGNNYNLFSPEVGSPKPSNHSVPVNIACPVCGFKNTFWGVLSDDGSLVEHYGRRCKGVEQYGNSNVQCDFRFRFKECDHCSSENDIAARKCHDCGKILIDPDDKLRDALNLSSLMVIRCSGMTMEESVDNHGFALIKITYHDEDGGELSEFFQLDTPTQQGIFYHYFGKYALINRGEPFRANSVATVIGHNRKFRKPDFVIAERKKRYWKIREKIFDYNGSYRKANAEH